LLGLTIQHYALYYRSNCLPLELVRLVQGWLWHQQLLLSIFCTYLHRQYLLAILACWLIWKWLCDANVEVTNGKKATLLQLLYLLCNFHIHSTLRPCYNRQLKNTHNIIDLTIYCQNLWGLYKAGLNINRQYSNAFSLCFYLHRQ